MKIWFFLFLGFTTAAQAGASSQDAFSWLKKMAAAGRQLNYSGTFVYQHGTRVETSRIVHFVNSAGGEFERLETLDGPAREIIRQNDQVTCYLPGSKTVLIEERSGRHFPALLPEQLTGISENYEIRQEGTDRVAGHDCVWIALLPKDELRYGRRFCADVKSALLLRARTYNEKQQAIESFAFTEVTVGGRFDRDRVRSKYADASKAQSWRIDRSGLSLGLQSTPHSGWVSNGPPAGFRKLLEVRRSIAGRAGAVSHIVFSDGLAAISVFIEPMPRPPRAQALTHQGSVNIYTRRYRDHVVTALGEAPAATVMQIANSLEYRGAAAAATR